MKTIKIWGDTIRPAFCAGPTCHRRIWWAQIVASGRQMCFNEKPEPIITETEILTKRELFTVDLDTNHWATCPDRQKFARHRPARGRTFAGRR